MADQLNVDIVNVRDVTQFTPETDITTMEFYSRKGSTNKKIDGAQVVAEVLTQSDLGTGFTNVSNNANLQTAITELDAAISGGGGGISYAAIDGGPLQAIGISGEVGYAGAAGSGIISLDNRWSMVKGDIVIDVANDTDGSNNFALTINVSNGTFNT